MKIPRKCTYYIHGNKTPDKQQIGTHVALFLGPIRIQQDFLTLMVLSRYTNENSQFVASAGVL